MLTPEERQQMLRTLKKMPHLGKREAPTAGERGMEAAQQMAERARVGVNQQAEAQGQRAELVRALGGWKAHAAAVSKVSLTELGRLRRRAEAEATFRESFQRARQRPPATSPKGTPQRSGTGQREPR